jgi:hypothetical protein
LKSLKHGEGKVNIIMGGEEIKEKEKRVCFESEREKNDIRCDVDGISTSIAFSFFYIGHREHCQRDDN